MIFYMKRVNLQQMNNYCDSERVEVNVETGKVPSLYVLAFLIAYFVLGATLFSQWEEWSFLEGLYFSFITLTTIGNRSVGLGTYQM